MPLIFFTMHNVYKKLVQRIVAQYFLRRCSLLPTFSLALHQVCVWGVGGVDWLIVSWIKVIREKGKLPLPPEF
jgi:hypothetical protein